LIDKFGGLSDVSSTVGGMNDQLPPLPDENTLVIPDSWRRSLHPRRGGAPGPKIKVERAAGETVRRFIEQTGGAVESLLAGKAGDLGLTEAARRHVGGQPDPSGAAAIAAVTGMGTGGLHADKVHRAFIDSWITEHGIAFAARALVELSRTEGIRAGGGDWHGTWVGAEHRKRGGLAVSQETVRRVRALLAAADDAEYQEAEERLEGHRDTLVQRWLVSYLVPTRQDWVNECCAHPFDRNASPGPTWLLYCSLGKGDQLTTPNGKVQLYWKGCSRWLLGTLADGLGAEALPAFLHNLDGGGVETEDRKRLLEAIALLPSDEAFMALMDRLGHKAIGRHARPVLLGAMKRFPVRALRLLAAAAPDSAQAASLLKGHLQVNAEVVAAVLPEMPEEVRAVVEPMTASFARVATAPPEALPTLLTEPPWERSRRPFVDGLKPPAGPGISWREGERERWRGSDVSSVRKPDDPDWEAFAQGYRTGAHKIGQVQLMVHGPEELVRPLLADWKGHSEWNTGQWMRVLVARYELDALPTALRMAKADPRRCDGPLMPFLHADVALFVGDRLARGGNEARTAREWLNRHGLAAVPLLVPAALGKAAKPRRAAEHALRHLTARHDLGGIVAAARVAHGAEAASALDALLSAHPVETRLVQPSKMGDWVDPAVLPQVLLRGREQALPVDATRRLVDLLTVPSPYGMDVIGEACDPESVAEFGWALFQRWRESGTPSKDGWALTQLGRTGDDETVRRLTSVIRAWPGEGGHKNAVNGLGVLAAIGSDVALMHLHGIAQKVKFKGLQGEAQARIREVADRLGLSTEQLADRLVPDFGLDADGSLVLDYGPRRFVVGFDEQLGPVVADEDGKRRKALPKPGAKDDAEAASAAYKAFAGLKKDVRTVAADQLRRLETAMVTGRRWTPGEFRDHLVNHPLIWHIARRLVWVSEDGGKATAFRIAEDRTFADVEDDAFSLPDSACVGIIHPVHLGDALEAWSEVFADYEILQPFPQLGRDVHTLTEDERAGGRLERFEGLAVPFGKVLGLVRRGWERGEPQDAGGERWISRRLAEDRHVVIELDPGISVGAVDATGDHQSLRHVWLATEPGDYGYRSGRDTPLRFGELDPAIASEILADLTTLSDAAV
jgi:hypothetical protein